VPVTLKIRTGWNRENRNGLNIARIAEGSGIAALAVHGRTRADQYQARPSTKPSPPSSRRRIPCSPTATSTRHTRPARCCAALAPTR
jgi:hypothetical protein